MMPSLIFCKITGMPLKHSPNNDQQVDNVMIKTMNSHKFLLLKLMRSSKTLQDVSEIALREGQDLCGIICILKATHTTTHLVC